MKTANNLLTKKTNFWLRMLGLAACLLVVLALSNPFGASAQQPTSAGKIAFTSNRDGNTEIYVMDADGANQTRLTNNPASDFAPGWGVSATTPPICTPPPSGIVAWLPGDGNANDISGNNNNGILQNGTTFAAGKVAQTFSFDGVDDRVQLGNPTSLQLQDFTIETWIKRSSASLATNNPDANNPGGIFLAYGGGGYGFFIDQPTNRLGLTHVGFSAAFSTATITDTNYHHVAVTKNGSTVTFYIDGVAGASVSYNPTFTFTTDAAIGARGDGVAQNAFFGNIDELSVYNRTLSQTEIQSIVDADSAGKCKPGAPTPGTLQFSAATYTVGENGAMATLTVTRTGGSDGLVSVDYTPGGGTASGGASCGGTVDYVNTGGTILFADGVTSQTFDVPICDDNLFEGDETFNATLSNATGGASIGTTNPAAVTITDNESPPLNTPPAANNDAATVAENSGATPIDVLANDTDADGDTLTITVVTNGANGSVAITGGGTSVTYTPNPNFSGADSFTYTISDGNGGTATATVNITVTPVNDPPIITAATAISRQRGAAGSVSTIAGVSDAEDAAGSLTVTVTSVPTGISVTGVTNTNGTITANVTANCSAAIGANTVGLKVTDSNGAMATANLTVNVTQETTPPVINPIANVVVNLPANSNATSMVVNFPTPTASDNCGGAVTVTTNPASGSTFPVGTTTVTVTATDSSGNVAMSSFTVSVRFRYEFRFDTFFSPYRVIRLNPVEAGSNVTVIFSLSGFKGYDIYSAPPASQRINCSTGNPMGAIQPIQTTVSADPLYNAGFDRYSTTWRTQAVWAGTCRRLILSLKDGTTQTMDFQFR